MRFMAEPTGNSAVDDVFGVKRKPISLKDDLTIVTRIAQGVGCLRFRLPFLPIHRRTEAAVDTAAMRSARSSGVIIGVAVGTVDS